MEQFEVAADRDALGEMPAVVEFEHWNAAERILFQELRLAVDALEISTSSSGTLIPFSARNMRTRRGLGASL